MVRFVLLTWLVASAAAATLEIGTASVEITGPPGYPMGGYGARQGVAKGTHDPLLAKVLLLRSGGRQFAFVTYDLLVILSARVAAEARQLGIDTLQIASHTHSGPFPKDRKAMESDPWWRAMEDKVIGAIRQAQTRFVPAEFSVAEGSVYLGHNRIRVDDDGAGRMFWRNAGRMPTHPVDPRIGILRFVSPQGKLLALLINYACHAVVLGPDNLDYSADWPGYLYRELERQTGAMAFYVPGAGGDINPYDDKQPLAEDAFGVARQTGERIAAAVLQAVRARPHKAEAVDLRLSQELIEFQDRFQPTARVPVQAARLLLSNNAGVLAAPVEAFVEHQMRLRDQSPLRHTFYFNYAYGGDGGWGGYVPTIEAAQRGGYGASYATRIEVGAGERLVDRAIVWFYEQLGKLRDVPDRP